MGSRLKGRLAKWFMMIAGAAMAIGGIWFGTENLRFLDAADRAAGTVTEIVGERGSRGLTVYRAVVRFTPRGETSPVTFKDRTGLWPSPFDIGDAVEVAYDPAAPASARIVSFWTIWFLPALTVAFGVVCAMVGFFRRV